MRRENKNGITLIALVITIIVLLVLAGVSLSLVLGDNGVLNKAQNATTETRNAEEKEKIEMAVAAAQTIGHGKLTNENLNNELSKVFANGTLGPETDNGWSYDLSDKIYNIDKTGKVEKFNYPQIVAGQKAVENSIYISNSKKAIIPAGFTVSEISGETSIENGLVIIDGQENEFVWIPVENYMTFVNDNEYKNLNYSDPTTEDNYKNMLKSIQEYGGFYIGRYEAGVSNPSKKNQILCCKENKSTAQGKSSSYNCDKTKIIPSLMYGIQYDAILRFISTYASTYNLTDSSNWGNYRGITKTFSGYYCYMYANDNWILEENRTDTYSLTGSGLIEEFKVLNIYDLTGNIIELTAESNGVGRGGGHQDDGKGDASASGRVTTGRMGFRYSFYIVPSE